MDNKEYTVGIFTFAKRHNRDIKKVGSSTWRGQWYWDNWKDAEEYVEGKKYDVVIFQKVWYEELYEALSKDNTTKVILDLCDPEWYNGNKMNGWPIIKIANLVDAIVVSSQGLYDGLKKLGVEKYCKLLWIDDRVDLKKFPELKRKKHTEKAKVVGWFGYRGNGELALGPVSPYLMLNNLELRFISDSPPRTIDQGYTTKFIEFSWDTLSFEINQCDFMLNPPIMSPLAQYKSKNKTYIPWIYGIPVAHNIEEFEKFLEPTKRQEESNRVYDIIRDNTVEKSIKQYKTLLKEL